MRFDQNKWTDVRQLFIFIMWSLLLTLYYIRDLVVLQIAEVSSDRFDVFYQLPLFYNPIVPPITSIHFILSE